MLIKGAGFCQPRLHVPRIVFIVEVSVPFPSQPHPNRPHPLLLHGLGRVLGEGLGDRVLHRGILYRKVEEKAHRGLALYSAFFHRFWFIT